MTTALEGGEGSASRPGRSLPPGKTPYPFYRRLGGPQGRSGQVRKISPPPGFNPPTVQRVASRYTDYATRPTKSDRIHLYRLLNTFHVSRVHTSCRFVTHEVVSQSSVIVWACIFEGKLRRLLAILVHYILIQVASRLHLHDKSGMQSSVFTPTAWNELYVVLSLIRLHFCLIKLHGVCKIKMASFFRNMAPRHLGTGVRRFVKA